MARKRLKMGKKALCLIFAFLLSIESFAAIVSDNDGAAFITKAEFDSLKNTFQSEINNFNSRIDDKIDGVINDYLSGIKNKRTTYPDILFKELDEDRRTFTNSWINPTTSAQSDIYLQIAKNIIHIYSLGMSTEKTNTGGTLTCYQLNTLSGNHSKVRLPVNNGKNGRYILTKAYDKVPGTYYIEDVGLYDIKEVIEINGGATTDSSGNPFNYFGYAYDPDLDFTDKTTDSIWTQDFLAGRLYRTTVGSNGAPDDSSWPAAPMGGSRIPPASAIYETYEVYVNAMCSICVMETNTGNQNFLKTMSSGAIWTTNTGTILQDGVHDWKYRYNNIQLAGAGAQAFGAIFYWNPSAINPNTGANTGYRQVAQKNVANDYRTEYEPISFMGPKVEGVSGASFIVKDVSDLVDSPLHYYSGLPLFELPYRGKLTLKLNLSFTNRADTIIAIRNQPFDNTSISSVSTKDLYWKRWSSADLATGEIKIEVPASSLANSLNKTLYIKLYNTNTTSGSDVTVSVKECVLEEVL